MNVVKCDKCRKLKDAKNRANWINFSIFGHNFGYENFDFCAKCGNKITKKILKIIQSNK